VASATPKSLKPIFFSWPFWVARPLSRAWGWPKPSYTASMRWPKPPQRPGGFSKPPHMASMGWPKPPPGPRGLSGHPQKPKPILFFFFFLGGRTTPAWGWLRPPYTGRRSHPQFSSFLLLPFKKKKKKKKKI
jgi:hypothetical protein